MDSDCSHEIKRRLLLGKKNYDTPSQVIQKQCIFLGSKITANGDYSHEIKRYLLLGRKVRLYIKKQRHYLANKGLYSQSYTFPVVMYRCESGTKRRLSTKELMFLKCGVGEDS